METEHFFICPHCWQSISMILDPTAGEQEYVEDCEVCCRPITIRFSGEGGRIRSFETLEAEL